MDDRHVRDGGRAGGDLVITGAELEDLRSMAAGMSSTPMSADILTRLVDDISHGGPVAQAIADHPQSGSRLFCLRALAGVRLLVLSGKAPELANHLKGLATRMGEPEFDNRTWELFRAALLSHPAEITAALDRPIQQHQPGRAGVLLQGLAMLAPAKINLLELGACAGLNLLLDRYRWFGEGWEWGDSDSTVRLATGGRYPGDVEIVARAGCDLAPRDPRDPLDAMILRSFLPEEREIDQLELDDALALASRSEVRVERADAVEWLARQFDTGVGDPSVLTVVWHSLFLGYLGQDRQDEIEGLMNEAARHRRLARVCFEPHSLPGVARLQVTVYS